MRNLHHQKSLGLFVAFAGLLLAPSFPVFASTITNFAGTGTKGFSGDGGPATKAELNGPTGVAVAPDGSLFICDTANQRIRKVSPSGIISTFAGTGEPGWSGDGGPATAAKLNEPYEVRFDTAGNVYWVERLSATVRKWDAKTHLVTTIAGSGTPGFSGDGGPATRAQLNEPHSIGFDPSGNLYICDVRNHRIRKLDMKTGLLSTFAGTGQRGTAVDGASISQSPLDGPRALDFSPAGELWLALREGNAILQLNLRDQTITRAAGTGKKGLSGDNGPATSAALNGPKGLSIAPNGDVVFADTENHAIRSLNVRTHTLSLLAGTGRPGDGTETDPLHCTLNRPHGVFVDRQGAVFIGDTDANRVRVIRP